MPAKAVRELIELLQQDTSIRAICPETEEEFRLSDAAIFFGDKLPEEATQFAKASREQIEAARVELRRRRKALTEGFTARSVAVKLGRTVEKILPVLQGFPYDVHDCRPLYDPIDFIVFQGLSRQGLHMVDFVDVKTGGSALTRVQRQVRDVVSDGQVTVRRI